MSLNSPEKKGFNFDEKMTKLENTALKKKKMRKREKKYDIDQRIKNLYETETIQN